MVRYLTAILTVVAMVAFVGVAKAQPADGEGRPGPRRGGPLMMIENALKKVDLTDEQKTKVKAIVEEARKKLEETMQAARESGDREAAREAGRKIVEETRTKLEGLLTEEQKEAFRQAMMEEMEARRPRGEGREGRPQRDR